MSDSPVVLSRPRRPVFRWQVVRALGALALLWAFALPGLAQAAPLSIGGSAQIGLNPEPNGRYIDSVGLLSPDGAYAYYSTDGCPARILKVRLSDLTVVDETLTSSVRANGQCYTTLAGAITASGEFGYFGSNDNSPSLVKVRLSDMEIVDSIRVVDAGSVNRGGINQVVLSADEATAVAFTNNGYILRIDLVGGAVTGSLSPSSGLSTWLRVVQTPDRHHVYVSTVADTQANAGNPAAVAKLDVAAFTRETGLTIPNSTSLKATARAISPDGAHLYYSLSPVTVTASTPLKLVKVRTSDFAQVASLTFPAGTSAESAASLRVSADGSTLWVGTNQSRIVKVDAATLQIAEELDLSTGTDCPNSCYPGSMLLGSRGGIPSLFVVGWSHRLAQVVVGEASSAPPGGGSGIGGTGSATDNGAGSGTTPASETPKVAAAGAPSLRTTAAKRRGGAVRQEVTVNGPGRVVMTVARLAGARSTLCRVSVEIKAAGTQAMSCKLRPSARKAFAKGPVRVRVVTTFTPRGGAATQSTSTLMLR